MNLSTFILCLILAIIVIIGFISIKKRFTSGCCNSESSIKRIKPLDKNINHYPYSYKFDLLDMHCTNCAIKIENLFNKENDMMAKINTNKKQLTIYAKEQKEISSLIQNIAKIGYSAKQKTEDL